VKNLDSDGQSLISFQRGGVYLDSKWNNGRMEKVMVDLPVVNGLKIQK